jgi:hypothetical protein
MKGDFTLYCVEVMKSGGNTYGNAATIYEDCMSLCKEFSDVVFEHIPMEANLAAHVLASKAEGSNSVVWKEAP